MRKITQLAVTAFDNNQPFEQSNTEVRLEDGKTILSLHGNDIAIKEGNKVSVSDGDYELSNTTKERLNGLRGVEVYTKKGIHYLNGIEWDGFWIEVK